MQKNTDGSVTLTKREFGEVNKAYQALYTILDSMPSTLEDYFREHKDYMNVCKWHCQLGGQKFDRADWE